MPFLTIAFVLIAFTWVAQSKGWSQAETYSRIAFFAVLIFWLWISAERLNFDNSEEALLLWFAYGLGIALVGEAFQLVKPLRSIAYASILLSALLFATGLDVFHPNAYAYLPASVLAVLVSLVALKGAIRLTEKIEEQGFGVNRAFIVVSTLSVALMLYSAFFKLMDRNWLLPWSYLIGLGALLWALSRLWMAWEILRGNKVVQSRITQAAYQLGTLIMVVAAFFHYQQYFN